MKISVSECTFSDSSLNSPALSFKTRGGHLPWFWVRMCGWSPRTPPHSYTRPSEKHDPFIYFPYRKLTPFIYYFWKLTPFIYYFSNFTHSYTFWVKKIPHWYTFDVKMIPIHILGGLKNIPHSSRTSVYTFIMEVTPPWFKSIRYSSFWIIRNWANVRNWANDCTIAINDLNGLH